MKKLFLHGGLWLAVGLSFSMVHAASIIKTNTGDLSYFDQLQIFRTGESTVQGWVRLNRGFAVASRASAFMDTFITVSGPMDLGETGTLVLNGNLFLDKSVTLTSGGNIKGKPALGAPASTIFLGGDLTLSATTYARTLHITGDWSQRGTSGDLIIDGMGHTLDIQDRAQLFVDTNITLTLRNMTIRTGPKSLMVPAICLASPGSKLVLDNVMFDLGADYRFVNGQLFIHNEVAVTGTSAFVYNSPNPSYITSGATWSFEQGTTFSVAPLTYTDIPFAAGTATSNNFIVLADQSAALSLSGCSLQTTFTGLRLSTGMVLFDNKVAIDTTAGLQLVTTGTTAAGFVGSVLTSGPDIIKWSPDGRFLAVVFFGPANVVKIYRFNGSGAPSLVGSAGTGTNPHDVAWSPDGRYLAVTATGSNIVRVFSFNGNSAPTRLGDASATNATTVAWSPDGRFLAVTDPAGFLRFYRFSGSGAPISLGPVSAGAWSQVVLWSQDGRYLAVLLVGTGGVNNLQIYRFTGGGLPVLFGTVPTGNSPQMIAWSADGRFLAVVNQSGAKLQIYRFDGGLPVSLGTADTGTMPYGVTWSPDGRYLVVANYGSKTLLFYRFDGTNVSASFSTVTGPSAPMWVAWSPDGRYVAVANQGTPYTVQVYRCNYNYSGQSQAFSTGLVFGDSAKGSNFDATIDIMGNARVGVKGRVMDDSA